MRIAVSLTLLMAAFSPASQAATAPANAWSRVAGPTPGPALSIGSTADGCLAGATALPADGIGYSVIRLGRRRYFGHPDLVAFVSELGRRAHAAGLPRFYVGDLAQPRGGPLPFGHKSHQTGLDVDLWFTFGGATVLPEAGRDDLDLPSMLLPGALAVDPSRFGTRQVTLLRLAAEEPTVDRIFVNPTIKLALCRGLAGPNMAWLHRLSPWWGHDDHFHVRLRCPETSPDCESQAPVPPGDGCDAALEDWTHHQTPTKAPANPGPGRVLPAACRAVLTQ
jgi:penicillin-insensitive murein endopeptidase